MATIAVKKSKFLARGAWFMQRILFHVGLAAIVFLGLAAFDRIAPDEPFSFAEFLLEDAPEWLLQSAVVGLASFSVARLRYATADRNGLAGALDRAVAREDHWRVIASLQAKGLSEAIATQFAAWGLTESESDIAMLMLKGLSHKEVGALRNSSAATVRQQAAAVYGKSGLTGRAELAAFFLEDLLPAAAANQDFPAPSDACDRARAG